HVSPSNPNLPRLYPISLIVERTTSWKSTNALVVISPATTARPVATSVSHATRLTGSCARIASRIESEIWSAILSGCPSVTDSDVNRWRPFRLMRVVLLQNCASPCRTAPAAGLRVVVDLLGGSEKCAPPRSERAFQIRQ